MAYEIEGLTQRVLEPLAGESPTGPDMRENLRQTSYSRLSTRLKEDRRYADSGGFEGEAADWQIVFREADDLLSRESKDLEVATWLVRGMYHTAGLPGLRDGLLLIRQFQEKFWDGMHPRDLDVRKGRLGWLEDKLVVDLRAAAPPTAPAALQAFQKDCDTLASLIHDWSAAIKPLYGDDAPTLRGVLEALRVPGHTVTEQRQDDVKKLVDPEQKRVVSESREDALRQLDQLATYFSTVEPLGPVGPALRRVARWARGSLQEWLSEMVDNPDALASIYKTLDMKKKD